MAHTLLDLIRETIHYGFTIMNEEENTLKLIMVIKSFSQNLRISLKINSFIIQISTNVIKETRSSFFVVKIFLFIN